MCVSYVCVRIPVRAHGFVVNSNSLKAYGPHSQSTVYLNHFIQMELHIPEI